MGPDEPKVSGAINPLMVEPKNTKKVYMTGLVLIYALEEVNSESALRGIGQKGGQGMLYMWDWEHHVEKLERVYKEVQGDSKPPRDA